MGKFTVGLVPHPTKSVLDSVEIIPGRTTRTQAHHVAKTSDAARVGYPKKSTKKKTKTIK